MPKKIAVFGGKFDPPHLGHQLTVFLALEKYKMDEVWIVPSVIHPFGYESSDFEHRVRMCEIMIRPWSKNKVKISKAETEIADGTGYTVDLIKHLKKKHPDSRFYLVIGADNWKLKEKWHNFEKLEKLCESIIIIGRGSDLKDGFSLPGISSTVIKEMIRKGLDPSPLLPDGIMEYIKESGLYR
ncbi:MAG TPA: nicotinate (nicotinamide) nucleotide adenylyltransferase [bacterium]|nr:nicotinate (nicotinamide) nucleotide adenylyltransferase [bacterium]HPS28998.1 nicotinate (nicotinamide) nucleotide adenylyltransferase [bacterium]